MGRKRQYDADDAAWDVKDPDDDTPFEPSHCTAAEASVELLAVLTELYLSNSISAKSFSLIAYWSAKAGFPTCRPILLFSCPGSIF